MSFSRETLDAIRARVSIAHLLAEQGVALRRSGRNLVALCPFHAERTPSFTLYSDHAHCFGCGWHGDAFAFVMKRGGCTFPEAVAQLAARLGLSSVPQWDQRPHRRQSDPDLPRSNYRGERDFTTFAQLRAAMATDDQLRPHADSMSVPIGILRELGCFAAVRASRKHGIKADPYGFLPMLAPMRRSIDGPVRGLRTRSLHTWPDGHRYACVTHSRPTLFIPRRVGDGQIWLPEGLSDTCALLAVGINAVGRPDSNAGEGIVRDLVRLCRRRDVVLLGDNDGKPDGSWPGRASVDRLASAVVGRASRLRVMFPPAGCKDMRDWIAAGATREDIEARLATHAVEHVTVITGARR